MYGAARRSLATGARGAAAPRLCVVHRVQRVSVLPRAVPTAADHMRWYASKAEEEKKPGFQDGKHEEAFVPTPRHAPRKGVSKPASSVRACDSAEMSGRPNKVEVLK